MEQKLTFTKASGAGNDFVIIENLRGQFTGDKPRLAAALCSRHFGIGADGLLLLEPSADSDFTMLYYNADGSSGGMCGNGGRCIARYAALKGIARSAMKFTALGFVYQAEVSGSAVRLRMKNPSAIRLRVPISALDHEFIAHAIDTGAPHLVVFDDSLEERDVRRFGKALAHHDLAGSDGTNVDFVQLLGGDRIAIRTFERGVEDETLACGTGSVASALISALQFGLRPPIHVRTQSGEDLHVEFRNDSGTIGDVVLTGSAHMIFSGVARYDESKGKMVDAVVDVTTIASGGE